MNYEVHNRSGRLVSIHCNSGQTCHLPPGYTHELAEAEIKDNAMVKKLKARKLITVVPAKESDGKSNKENNKPDKKMASEAAGDTAREVSDKKPASSSDSPPGKKDRSAK